MKPLLLTMSAFGSYADETTIDFTKQEQGIFLITGDTGAGKTTIFDAMMYALYHQTSGGERDGNMMRSQYAKDTTETYVVFCFSYAGKVYQIRRNPEYVIKRKLKNGALKERKITSAVELTMPDGMIFPEKKSGTDAKILEIVGLTAAQFTQTVMIAQGEFLKLLYTKSEERKKIFSKLFHTDSYWSIQERLKQMRKEMEEQLLENERAFAQEQSRIIFPEAMSKEERDAISLDELVQWNKETERKNRKKRKEYQEQLEELGCAITQAETENRLFDKLEEAQQQREKLKKQEEEEAARRQQIDAARRAQRVFRAEERFFQKRREKEQSAKEVRRLTDWIFAERAQYQKEEKLLKEEEEAFRQQMQEEERSLHRLEESLPEYERLTAARQKEEMAKKTYQNAKEQFERRLFWDFQELRRNEEACKSLRTEVEECEKMQSLCHREVQKAQSKYEQIYEALMQTQAGRLAEMLREGAACPVCGSLAHPAPAQLPEGAVDETDLKKAKEKRNAEEEKREKADELLNCKREAYHEKKNELLQQKKLFEWEAGCSVLEYEPEMKIAKDMAHLTKEQGKTLPRMERLTIKELARDVQAAQEAAEIIKSGLTYDTEKQARDQIKKLCLAMEEARKSIEEKQRLQIQAKEKINQAEGKLSQEEERQKQLEKENEQAAEEFDTTCRAAGFKDAAEYEQSRMSEDRLEELETQSMTYQRAVEDNRTVIAAYQQEVKGRKRVDITEKKERQQKIKDLLKEAQKQENISYSARVTNEDVKKKNAVYLEKRSALRERGAVVKSLSDTANGRLSQSVKLDFETYVQRHYFEQIINEANKRLLVMSQEQFILKLKEAGNAGKKSNEGLDLSVYSLITDSERDIKTLSGGESFLAALAMALGLADIAARNAGAIRMDMMFIDEGFGSLDMQARTQAIKVLNELAGGQRMIGIISHVTELKEQIDRKLIVSRTEHGSRAFWSEGS